MKGHIAREPIELGDQHCASLRAGAARAARKLGPAIQRIGALARLGLGELGDNGEAFGFRKAGHRSPLRLYSEP
jgi:hypothetical protein